MKVVGGLLLVVLCALGLPHPALAQGTSISGTVLDSDRAAVANAAIIVTAIPDGRQTVSTSRGDGTFVIEGLPAGRYVVDVRASGFARCVQDVQLAGQPVSFEAVLQVAGITEELVVRGAAAATVSKVAVPLKDQPLSVSTISGDFLRTFAINNMVDAIQNIPNANAYQQYGVYEYFAFRGFSDSVQMVDGIRFEGNRLRSGMSNVERVEVLKGPASVLGGAETIGATVNIVLKKPAARQGYEGEFSFGSWNTTRVNLGATGPLRSDALLYRLDFGYDRSDGFRRDVGDKMNVTPSLLWRISPLNRLEARYSLNRNDLSGDSGIPQITTATTEPVIPNVPRDRRYNTPQDYALSTIHNIRVQYSLALSSQFAVRNVTSGQRTDDDYWVAETLGFEPPSLITRQFLYFKHHRRPWTNQFELTGHVGFLKVGHDLLVGWDRQDYSNFTTRSTKASVATTPIDLYNPVETHVTRTDFTPSRYDYTNQLTNALYVQDQMTLHSKLKAVFGIRHDRLERETFNNPVTNGVETQVAPTLRRNRPITWRAGVVYQPTPRLDLYAQSATAFRPNFNLQPDGSPIDPEEGLMYEGGPRLRLLNDRMSVSGAAFYIEKRNVAQSRPGGFFDLVGKVRSKGLEAEVEGRLGRSWLVRGGYGYTGAEYVDYFTTTAVFSGNVRPRVPRHSLNVSSSYIMGNGIALSAASRVFSRQFLNDANTLAFDGYGLLDLSASFTHSRLQYRVTMKNVTDTAYWASALGQRQFYPGEPRSLMATIRVLTN